MWRGEIVCQYHDHREKWKWKCSEQVEGEGGEKK
jgi:hypothetical protein